MASCKGRVLNWGKDVWDLVLVLPLSPIVTLDSCFSSSLALFPHLQNEDVEIETLRALLT